MIELIEAHMKAKKDLDAAKKLELILRKQIIDQAFDYQGEGVANAYVGNVMIKATFGYTRTLDMDAVDANMESFSDAERSCLVMKTALSVSRYKNLSDKERTLLDECITVKPSLPSIKMTIDESDNE